MTLAPLGDGWVGDGSVRARVRRDGDILVVEASEHADAAAYERFLDALSAVVTNVSQIADGEGRVLRSVSVAPVDDPPPITLGQLEEAIRRAWSAETSGDPQGWSEANPSYQHCDVTARVVHDHLGGHVLVAGVVLDGVRVDRHAWNRLRSGVEVDLTRGQFLQGERFEDPTILEQYIGPTVEERYARFAARVRDELDGARRRHVAPA